jgi:catechol 2,3-dioxygenase-like lactoylglutathione lyase family enzyme
MKRFNGICILTHDIHQLGCFYRDILQVELVYEGDNITCLTDGAQLSIFSVEGMERMAPGSMDGAGCGNFTFDFEVEDVDWEYERLIALGVPCLKLPVTYPWGRRSAWFRDPDGNILNLFSRVIYTE